MNEDALSNRFSDAEPQWLAPYAMHSQDSEGRVHPEPAHPYRGPFQRDRDRVIHSSAFRRLAHKTQVFTGEMGDYHRTRLTHTLEVASIARTIGRALRLNEDLIEALCLAHDIGHPPFGHAGEDVLDECLREQGGFNHNRQALRIVELLESRYPEFPGLNLSREVLSGQQTRAYRGQSSEQPLLEVQVVDAADSIAYDSHDADDSLELGLLEFDQLLAVPLWREAAEHVQQRYTALQPAQLRSAIVHRLIEKLVSDLLDATRDRFNEETIQSVASVRNCQRRLVAPSEETARHKLQLERFLFNEVYRHPTVLKKRLVASEALREMFERFSSHPEKLPEKFLERADVDGLPRAIADFLAGMTDRYAMEKWSRQ